MLTSINSKGSQRAGVRQSTLPEAERSQKPVLSGETTAPYFVELRETEATICWVSSKPSLKSVVVHGPHGTKTYCQTGAASRLHQLLRLPCQQFTDQLAQTRNRGSARKLRIHELARVVSQA